VCRFSFLWFVFVPVCVFCSLFCLMFVVCLHFILYFIILFHSILFALLSFRCTQCTTHFGIHGIFFWTTPQIFPLILRGTGAICIGREFVIYFSFSWNCFVVCVYVLLWPLFRFILFYFVLWLWICVYGFMFLWFGFTFDPPKILSIKLRLWRCYVTSHPEQTMWNRLLPVPHKGGALCRNSIPVSFVTYF
jgi:hypothetical protein